MGGEGEVGCCCRPRKRPGGWAGRVRLAGGDGRKRRACFGGGSGGRALLLLSTLLLSGCGAALICAFSARHGFSSDESCAPDLSESGRRPVGCSTHLPYYFGGAASAFLTALVAATGRVASSNPGTCIFVPTARIGMDDATGAGQAALSAAATVAAMSAALLLALGGGWYVRPSALSIAYAAAAGALPAAFQLLAPRSLTTACCAPRAIARRLTRSERSTHTASNTRDSHAEADSAIGLESKRFPMSTCSGWPLLVSSRTPLASALAVACTLALALPMQSVLFHETSSATSLLGSVLIVAAVLPAEAQMRGISDMHARRGAQHQDEQPRAALAQSRTRQCA